MTTVANSGLLVSEPIQIEKAWIDYNDHLNMAYYNVIFDRALDEVLDQVGLGPAYIDATGFTFVAAEAHICFLRELMGTDSVRVVVRILDVDAKRMHVYCEMQHAVEGWVAATSEWMFLSLDLTSRRTTPWPDDLRANVEAFKEAASGLPRPERAGRSIGIPRKA